MDELLAPFERMLGQLFPPARVRAIDAGAAWRAEHAEIEASGFLDALHSLPLAQVVPLWRALGRHAAPLAIGETMIERGGLPCEAQALLLAAAISGAADRVLEMTAEYANQRVQFGKPIGRQQALQQQLAVMAEDCVAVRLAVDLAAAGAPLDPLRVAAAKALASAAAPRVANAAHGVHGAIGISAEYDLQLYTRRLHEWRLAEGGETRWNRALGQAVLQSPLDALGFVRAQLFGEAES